MDIIFYILPICLFLGGGFLLAFFWATKSGQYDDLVTPAHRILLDDHENKNINNTNKKEKGDADNTNKIR